MTRTTLIAVASSLALASLAIGGYVLNIKDAPPKGADRLHHSHEMAKTAK